MAGGSAVSCSVNHCQPHSRFTRSGLPANRRKARSAASCFASSEAYTTPSTSRRTSSKIRSTGLSSGL